MFEHLLLISKFTADIRIMFYDSDDTYFNFFF